MRQIDLMTPKEIDVLYLKGMLKSHNATSQTPAVNIANVAPKETENQIPAEALEKMKRDGNPSIEEQQAYWEKHDIGGNILEDRRKANEDWFNDNDKHPFD